MKKHVLAVRGALGDSPKSSKYIETVPKLGYRFIAPISEIVRVRPVVPTHGAREAPASERSRLPPRLDRMIGRDDEVAAVRATLLRQRFVTIVGPGGMGKTTVAISVAHALVHEFPDCAVFVDLAAIADASLVAGMVAAALGMAVHSIDPEPGIVVFLDSRRVLWFWTTVSTLSLPPPLSRNASISPRQRSAFSRRAASRSASRASTSIHSRRCGRRMTHQT